jgi:hypothetical protein
MEIDIQDIIANTYSLNVAIPVVQHDQLQLIIEKGTFYKDEIIVTNRGEGDFRAYLESVSGIIKIENKVISGKECTIFYQIDATQLLDNIEYKDAIVMTYIGGEVVMPILIKVVNKKETLNKRIIAKETKRKEDVFFRLNKRVYNEKEVGTIKVWNSYKDYSNIKMSNALEQIGFSQGNFQLLDEKEINFSFNISEADKAHGKIPLRTTPVVHIKVKIEVTCDHQKTIKEMLIPVTEYQTVPAKRVIKNDREYKALLIELHKQYIYRIVFDDNQDTLGAISDDLCALINYNLDNVDLRLLYALLLIAMKKKLEAIEIINEIEKYMLYYDKKNESVSQVLFCLRAIINEERCYPIVKRWPDNKDDSIAKLIVKQYVNIDRYTTFEDYKRLFDMGVHSSILFALAAHCLMNRYYYPREHDTFYKAVSKWIVNKDLVTAKWAKKVDQSSIIQIDHYNIDSHITSNLYRLFPEREFLKLLAKTYIHDEISNLEAYHTFLKCLKEGVYIKNLEYYYVKAAYDNSQLIQFEYINILFNEDQHLDDIMDYFYINLLIERDTYTTLYKYHIDKINALRIDSIPFAHIPESKALKENLCQLILENRLNKEAFKYYMAGELFELNKELLINLSLMVYEKDAKQGQQLLLDMLDRNLYDGNILLKMNTFMKGSLSNLLNFYSVAQGKMVVNLTIVEDLLIKGILTRQFPNKMLEVYIDYLSRGYNPTIVKGVNEYYAAQILIEDYVPDHRIVSIFEDYISETDHLSVQIALLKSYYLTNIRNEVMINRLIYDHRAQGIVFPWYLSLVSELKLYNSERMMQYFEHYSKASHTVYFYYRLENDQCFKKVKMQHITLGMFIYKIVMFYNEVMEYYIEEVSDEGHRDILTSDIFVCNEVTEQEDMDDIYDLINTALMSQEMNDFNSFEQAVGRCVALKQEDRLSMELL